MNNHLPQSIREALAPWAPYVPPVESLNDDDAYVVDLGQNCVVRQCSAALLRSGGSIPVGLNQAVMTGMHARHHIAYEQERRAKLGKPAGCDISPENGAAEVESRLIRMTEQRDELLREMKRHIPIIDKAEGSTIWEYLTSGTGIATANGYRAAIAKVKGGAA